LNTSIYKRRSSILSRKRSLFQHTLAAQPDPALYPDLGFNFIRDFAMVGGIYRSLLVLESLGQPTEAGWQLIGTPNPQGGAEAVSIMRSADFLQSDPDLAGLMVRCAPKSQELLIVMIRPMPPGAPPHVDIGAAGKS
jgi:hypothetical protein